jgi:hypothetical protein
LAGGEGDEVTELLEQLPGGPPLVRVSFSFGSKRPRYTTVTVFLADGPVAVELDVLEADRVYTDLEERLTDAEARVGEWVAWLASRGIPPLPDGGAMLVAISPVPGRSPAGVRHAIRGQRLSLRQIGRLLTGPELLVPAIPVGDAVGKRGRRPLLRARRGQD